MPNSHSNMTVAFYNRYAFEAISLQGETPKNRADYSMVNIAK